MVGSACWRRLSRVGYTNLVGKNSKELDLRDQLEVERFLKTERPVAIINAAARVGGILANKTFPYEFLMENLLIQNHLIQVAHSLNIPKFIFLGSSCIYPKFAQQPIKEEYLLTGSLEATNEGYALAKIAGVKLIEFLRKQYKRDYLSLMPTNLYGPGDNFDLESSHVLPAMLRKFHEAKVNGHASVNLWGTGSPFREFLHVDDLASAVHFSLENQLLESLYNVGSGVEISIKDLAALIQKIVGYEGEIHWDRTKPNGTPRKLLDSSKLKNLGWKVSVSLEIGIKTTYQDFF